MNHSIVQVVVAAAAGFGGGWVAQAIAADPPVHRAETQSNAVAAELRERVVVLERSVASARARPAEVPVARPQRAPREAPQEESIIEVESSEPRSQLFKRMIGRKFGRAQSDEMYAYLGSHHEEIEGTIASLRDAVSRDPNNPELHCALATAIGAKTAFVTPRGPEQGVVWEEATKSYNEALRIEPNHWEARYSLAFGDSMAPEFVGLRPKVIKQFTELMQIQEGGNPEPCQALVYMRLGTMYKEAGNIKKAREVWRRGLDRHADDTQLRNALSMAAED